MIDWYKTKWRNRIRKHLLRLFLFSYKFLPLVSTYVVEKKISSRVRCLLVVKWGNNVEENILENCKQNILNIDYVNVWSACHNNFVTSETFIYVIYWSHTGPKKCTLRLSALHLGSTRYGAHWKKSPLLWWILYYVFIYVYVY